MFACPAKVVTKNPDVCCVRVVMGRHNSARVIQLKFTKAPAMTFEL